MFPKDTCPSGGSSPVNPSSQKFASPSPITIVYGDKTTSLNDKMISRNLYSTCRQMNKELISSKISIALQEHNWTGLNQLFELWIILINDNGSEIKNLLSTAFEEAHSYSEYDHAYHYLTILIEFTDEKEAEDKSRLFVRQGKIGRLMECLSRLDTKCELDEDEINTDMKIVKYWLENNYMKIIQMLDNNEVCTERAQAVLHAVTIQAKKINTSMEIELNKLEKECHLPKYLLRYFIKKCINGKFVVLNSDETAG